MHVTIEHFEVQRGMLRKTTYFGVRTTVRFSEVEKAIVARYDLGGVVAVKRPPPDDVNEDRDSDIFNLTISKLMRGPDEYLLATPLRARNFEVTMTEELKTTKEFIDNNTPISEDERVVVFEL